MPSILVGDQESQPADALTVARFGVSCTLWPQTTAGSRGWCFTRVFVDPNPPSNPRITTDGCMKFSLIHLPTFYPEVHHSDAQFYQYILEQSDRAELHGFHSVWFAEGPESV